MRFQNLIGTLLLGSSTLLNASPTQAEPFSEETLESRQTATIPVTGVTGNGVQVRMELRTMQQQHPNMFNIYLLGLQHMMKNTANTDPLSYYQIAGIHGRPYVPWDGVGSGSGYGGGYCTHTSNLFLPWHRPYLALYEQTLYSHMQTVVNTFPAGATRDKYASAAANFRLPYWDWAATPCSTCKPYPLLVSQYYISVTTPSGQQNILNPLYRYDFHPISASDMVYNPFATWTYTRRYPTNWSADAVSQNPMVATQIANNQVSFQDRLYNLFTAYSNFSQFGDEAWISSSTSNADSLESLHDALHSILGNNGHMTYLDYAAYDPIFWLHHTMVDRCFALWQSLYPNSYVQPLAEPGSTYTYPAGTVNDVNSPLPPFHTDTKGTNYTSQSVRSVSTFGYTYPELANGASAASVRSAINKLYGTTAGSTTVSKGKRGLLERSTIDNVTAAAAVQSAVAGDSGKSYQYIANIVSQKFAMNGSYAVYIFLGNYSSDPTEWPLDQNLVGTHAVFANLANEASFKRMATDLKITGAVPLTTMLVNKVASGQLASLSPSVVGSYLTTQLSWRVAMFDGTEVPVANVPDLSVSVVQAQVEPAAAEDEFPTWGAVTALVNVTANRAGGHDGAYWPEPEAQRPYPTANATSSPTILSIPTVTVTSTTLLPLASCSSTCSA
ncbi:hypothetical protein MBLNU459_g4469t1 [Dothideomycetes sp. NU459]